MVKVMVMVMVTVTVMVMEMVMIMVMMMIMMIMMKALFNDFTLENVRVKTDQVASRQKQISLMFWPRSDISWELLKPSSFVSKPAISK